ncbi:MAG: uridine kinase [Cellvibrionaceae bacterium]|nr:uridine kinase [Cellvibrionaceae bacterium]
MSNCKIIAIAGGSCSGKTTIAKSLSLMLSSHHCDLVFQDNYYRGLASIVNFDVPEAIEFELMAAHLQQLKSGRSIAMPTYDFASHRRQQATREVKASSVIIVDGILILHAPELRDVFDFKVFIECSEAERRNRRLMRDCRERGRSEAEVLAQFNSQVAPLHDKYVEPSKQYADLIFPESQTADTDSDSYRRLLNYCLGSEAHKTPAG